MLITCPECSAKISDKAASCPHCGLPLNKAIVNNASKKNRRRRLPNGFGQISKISGQNLRNPYRAMVTVGKNEVGRPVCKPLKPQGFFKTYNEAYEALVEYWKNPYDLDDGITVKELYEKWTSEYFESLKTKSSARTISSAWAYCSVVYNMRARDLRARHIKGCIDDGFVIRDGEKIPATPNIKSRIKSLFNLMLDYALEYEIVDKNYARTFNLSDEVLEEKEEARRSHLPFTDEEMKKLWDNVDIVPYVDVILIQCYSGWRPQELGLIRLENVDLKNWTFMGGMKTKAGINRVVPIHSKIRPLVERKYKQALELGSEYLINCTDGSGKSKNDLLMTYDKLRPRFEKIKGIVNLNSLHRCHDGRMHFITMAKKYGVDEYAIKYMVGHAIDDITEKVYTKRDPDWLKTEIEKLK